MDNPRSPVLLQHSFPVHIFLPADASTPTPPSEPAVGDRRHDTNEALVEGGGGQAEHRGDPPTSLEDITSHTSSIATPVEAALTSPSTPNAGGQPLDILPVTTLETPPIQLWILSLPRLL